MMLLILAKQTEFLTGFLSHVNRYLAFLLFMLARLLIKANLITFLTGFLGHVQNCLAFSVTL